MDDLSFRENFTLKARKYLSDEQITCMKRQVCVLEEKSESSVVLSQNIEHKLIFQSWFHVLIKFSLVENMLYAMRKENLKLLTESLEGLSRHLMIPFYFTNYVKIVKNLLSPLRKKLTQRFFKFYVNDSPHKH